MSGCVRCWIECWELDDADPKANAHKLATNWLLIMHGWPHLSSQALRGARPICFLDTYLVYLQLELSRHVLRDIARFCQNKQCLHTQPLIPTNFFVFFAGEGLIRCSGLRRLLFLNRYRECSAAYVVLLFLSWELRLDVGKSTIGNATNVSFEM